MSARERNLAIMLIALIVLFGSAAAGYALVYLPIAQKNTAAAKLDEEIEKKEQELAKALAEQKRLAVLNRRSLPPDQSIARREYGEIMSRLLQQAKVPPNYHVQERTTPDNTGTPQLAAKKPAYSKVVYEVTFEHADMWAVHDSLLGYYRLDLLQQITYFEVKIDAQAAVRGVKVNNRKDLYVKLVTEAIILDGAEARRTLLPVPAAFAAVGGLPGLGALVLTPESSRGMHPIQIAPVLATRSRDYTLIVQNDILHGPLPLPPSMTVEKIADVVGEVDEPLEPVKVRVAGDLGPSGKLTISAKAETGLRFLPDSAIKVNQADHSITFTPAKGEAGKSKVRVAVLTDDGKKAETTFTVEIKEPVAKEEKKVLPDISDSIRLIIAATRSDGTATAVVRDNFNPLTYEIEMGQDGRIKILKYDHIGPRKKLDRTYRLNDPGMLIISDDASSTNRSFKVIAVDSDGLVLADTKPVKPEKPVEKEKVPQPARVGQGPAEPLAALAGLAATGVPAPATPGQPALYRWTCGTSLKAVKEISRDEAKKYQQRSAVNAPASVAGAAATGN
jgi:hypothetical protein